MYRVGQHEDGVCAVGLESHAINEWFKCENQGDYTWSKSRFTPTKVVQPVLM